MTEEQSQVQFRACLSHLERYTPGRNPDTVQAEFGFPFGDILKMASNESAYGPCPAALEAKGFRRHVELARD